MGFRGGRETASPIPGSTRQGEDTAARSSQRNRFHLFPRNPEGADRRARLIGTPESKQLTEAGSIFAQIERRERNRITELPANKSQVEDAARILWQDAQWLRMNAGFQLMGLRYAHIVLQDIRALIASPASYGSQDQQRQLFRSKVAIATINLRQRLVDAGVDPAEVEELKFSIMQQLDDMSQSSLSTPVNDNEIQHEIDELIGKIDQQLRRADHKVQPSREAKNIIQKVSFLTEDVALELFAVAGADFVIGEQLTGDLAKTAILTAITTSLAALARGASAFWRQPNLAPHLVRAYKFLHAQIKNLTSKLDDATNFDRAEVKNLAFGIQVAIYAVLTLIELVDGWVAGADCIAAGEKLLCICSRVVEYCDNAASEYSPPELAAQLNDWRKADDIAAIPGLLHLRKEAGLSKISRLTEAFGFGNLKLWAQFEGG